ncbi:MAG TPA: Rmf/CrpP family protein [Acetobacteraceae bacterium]|jgi:ribosome modulation factor|nr:Rmf/CrpP family protein [Acetobacteraceae bacterium]
MTDEPDLPTSVYDEGVDSFRQGVPRDDCPYPPGAGEREDWLRGWDETASAGERDIKAPVIPSP